MDVWSDRKDYQEPKIKNVVYDVLNSQIHGRLNKPSVKKRLRRGFSRRVNLESIVPSEETLAHVFLGFTQEGQYLISYKIEGDSLVLYLWIFRMHHKLVLRGSHVVYKFVGGHDVSLARDYYDSTALSIYQWPQDPYHLLVFVVPDHPLPDIISVCVIHFDSSSSCIIKPGLIPFSVVGWGQRYNFIEEREKHLSFEEVLTPGLVFNSKRKCAFHTGSEVISLSIEPAYGLTSEILVHKSLDIEYHLGNLIEGGTEDNFIRLITYELFVFGIHEDDDGTEIDTFVHAVIQNPQNRYEQGFRELTMKWNVEKDTREVIADKREEDSQRIRPKYFDVFHHMFNDHSHQRIYFLDNMHFVENQLSYDSLSSPTDSVVLELGVCGPISQDVL
jgi:hypothetical protein